MLEPPDGPMIERFWQMLADSFRYWSEARASQMAAALTYYAMLSLAPTMMIAIALASYLFDDELARGEILTVVQQVTTPEIARTIGGLIDRAQEPRSGIFAGSISIVVLVVGASGVFTQLYDTFNRIWQVESLKNGFWFNVQKRLIGIAMVLVMGLLLIAALVLNSVEAYVSQLAQGHPMVLRWMELTDRSLSYLLVPAVFSLMFWFFPATRIRLRDVIPAAVLTALLVAGSRYFIQLYLKMSTTSEVYGAAGSLVVMLIWVYITGLVVFYGAAFSHAWTVHYGSGPPFPAAPQPVPTEAVDGQPVPEPPPLVPQRRQSPPPPPSSPAG